MEHKDYLVKDSEKGDYFVLGIIFLIVIVGLGYFLFFAGINYFEKNVVGKVYFTVPDQGACFNATGYDGLEVGVDVTLCKNTYTLNEGVIIIGSITLDCNKSTINGNNSYNGLERIGDQTATIQNCHFRSFRNDVYLESSASANFIYNKFDTSSNKKIVNNRSANINLSKNYWGTLDYDAIEESIYDWDDDHSLGNVSYKPILCRDPITQCVEEECLKCNPVISNSFTQILLGKNAHPTIDLSAYVSDLDSPAIDLDYSFSGKNHVTIVVSGSNATIIPDTDWEGDDDVVLTVTDADDLSDQQAITIKVGNINHAPVIDYVDPDDDDLVLEIGETSSFTYNASDEDGDTLTASWKLDNNNATTASSYSFTAASSNVGDHELKLTVSDGNLTDTYQWDIEVIEEGGIVGNRFPTLKSNIPDQTWNMDEMLIGPDLDDHFSDSDGDHLTYSIEYVGNTQSYIDVRINFTNNQPYFYPKADWNGTGKVVFIANDGHLIKKSNNVTLTVKCKAACVENWVCSEWIPPECPENRTQVRTCNEQNSCGTQEDKPAIVNICEYVLSGREGISEEQDTDKTGIQTENFSPSSRDYKMVLIFIMVVIVVGLFGMFAVEGTKSIKKAKIEKVRKSIDSTSMIRLIQYLRREMSYGYTQEELKKILMNEGWNEIILDGAFAKLREIMTAQQVVVHKRHYGQEGIKSIISRFER